MVQIGGQKFAIKYFKRVTLANRFIYKFFRKSKAQRSYENALVLQSKNILTPQPVAFVETYTGLQLRGAYFVSLYVDCSSLDEVVVTSPEDGREIMTHFAQFVFKLHQENVIHKDLNLTNVLYRKTADAYQFCLIDINRMHFVQPKQTLIAKNLRLINLPIEYYAILVDEYARLSALDPYYLLRSILNYRQVSRVLRTCKNKVKKIA